MPPQSFREGYNIPFTFTKHFHQKVWSSSYFHRCHFFSHMLILTFHLLPEIHLKRKHPVKCVNVLIIFLSTTGLWIHIFNLANFQSVCWIFLSDIADTCFRKIRNTNWGEKKNQRSCSFLPLVLFICCCLCWETFSASPLQLLVT